MTVQKVYISQQEETNELDYDHLNTDVIVDMKNGDRYRATFISIKELTIKMQEDQQLKAGFGRRYFWSRNMVIINGLGKYELLPMIEYMIKEGDFQIIFEKL